MTQLKLDARKVEWRVVDDEIVALDLADEMYLAINHSGAVLWRPLAEGATRDELIVTLVAEYEIDADTAAADVDAFVAELGGRGLLE